MANRLLNIDDFFKDLIDLDSNDLPSLDQSVTAGEPMTDEGDGGEGGDVGSTNSNIIGCGVGGDNDVSGHIKSEGFEGTEAEPVPIATQQQQRQPSSGHSKFVGGGAVHQGAGVGVNLRGIGRAEAGTPEISPTTDAARVVAASGRGRGSAVGGEGRGGRGGRGVTKFSARSEAAIAGVDEDGRQGRRAGGKRQRQGGRNMTEKQRLDRRCSFFVLCKAVRCCTFGW